MSEEDYHAHPALSSSGARKLLSDTPAAFKYERDNPPGPKDVFDFGHAAHKMVLGTGPKLVRVPFKDRRTNAYKEKATEVRAAGGIPLLPDDYQRVQDMASALRQAGDIAPFLFNRDHGAAEQSIFWPDPWFGVPLRARLDWLPDPGTGRTILVDYKTTEDASNWAIGRTIVKYRYYQQGPWYIDAAQAVGRASDDAVFVFVFQEKTAPYLVNVVQLDHRDAKLGRERNHRAIEIFRDCTESGIWPGYMTGTRLAFADLPAYVYREDEE